MNVRPSRIMQRRFDIVGFYMVWNAAADRQHWSTSFARFVQRRVWTPLIVASDHWRVTVAFLTFTLAIGFIGYIVFAGKTFWDFAVYRAGVAAYQATGTAYDPQFLLETYGVGLPFTYPPLILLLFSKLSWLFATDLGRAVLVIAHVLAFLLIPYLLIPRSLRRTEFVWMFGVYLVAFGLSGCKLLLAGNIAALLSALIVGALNYSATRKLNAVFWVALFLVCQIKIYFVCLVAIPFLVERKIWVPAAMAVLIVAGYALNYMAPPRLLEGFTTTLASVTHISAFGGTSVMTAVQTMLDRLHISNQTSITTLLAVGIHCLYALVMMSFAVAVMWSKARPKDAYVSLLWAFMGALLISPRLAPYDLALLVIPFLVFLRQLVISEDRFGLHIAMAAAVLAAGLATTPLADWGALVVLCGVWGGIGCDWLMQKHASSTEAKHGS